MLMNMFRAVVLLLLSAQAAWSAGGSYLFAGFKGNGEDGVYFAISSDGWQWELLNAGRPVVKVEKAGELMRDPQLARGPNGDFHLVWTWSWNVPALLGHATSRDLVNWSGHQALDVMAAQPGTKNVWAPEAHYEADRKRWLLIWSSTAGGAAERDHRIWSATTVDFSTVSAPKLLFDPGFSVIDGTLLRARGKNFLIFKDEREQPLRKFIQYVSGPSMEGPWGAISAPVTEAWNEGPSALRVGDEYRIYFDHYRKPQHYGVAVSKDMAHWTDETARLRFPEGLRHGSFLAITDEEAGRLRSMGRAVANRRPLQPNAFNPLPLTAVKPTGWLLEQLRIQADGLSGHLDEFWQDLGKNSGWLGGTGESWERGPYYLDGLVPLAYLTGDARLINKVKTWMDWTLEHTQPDGWIGPTNAKDPKHPYDWWPNFVMLKALSQYQEATGDARVIPAMEKYFAYQAKHLEERPLQEWAVFRWQDEVLTILWLYNRNGDASLLELARRVRAQGHDWEAQFAKFPYPEKVSRRDANLASHGVNNGMAMKAAPVAWVLTGDPRDRAGLDEMLGKLDRFHAQPEGIFGADEHLAGRDPSQGTELCTVVEAMFSLETDAAILGDATLGDRLERVAYNALPGTMTADMWAHQYDQQANQVMCSLANRRWTTNGPASNIFGLEPNFGCCTANLHQGWPKLAANLWMATPDHGLAAIAYGPSEVTAVAGNGAAVTLSETTEYPFRETVALRVKLERAAEFPLALRIPGWAAGATVTVNGAAAAGVKPGEFFRVMRTWKDGDRVELRFPMAVRTSTWYNDSVAVERGPLVYSLKIGESWHALKKTGPATDWEVFPTTPWNYALAIDRANPAAGVRVTERPMGRQPFSADGSPIELMVRARRLAAWQLVDDSAGTVPVSPVRSNLPEEEVTLIPYGAAKLRITAFPTLAGTH